MVAPPEAGAVEVLWAEGLPEGFAACTTRRFGGVSHAPYASFNLAAHVGDAPVAVAQNRLRLRQVLQLPAEPLWLEQVHGVAVAEADCHHAQPPVADASYSHSGRAVCAVLTADCLPVVFVCANSGEIAAAHAGWRGLLDGVLLQTLARFDAEASLVQVWLGPAIGSASFEVGAEVRALFLQRWPAAQADQVATCFVPQAGGKYLADLYQLARIQLRDLGVVAICGGEVDTLRQSTEYFSYRAQAQTGRMATLVWRC